MATIEEIRDAWDAESGEGRDADTARSLADEYVAAHPDVFASLEDKTIPELVRAVDVFRDAGMDDEQWRIETWLLHRFEPQVIGGEAQPTIRIPAP